MTADTALLRITDEPYYHPVGNEVSLLEASMSRRLSMMLKGPTGCGKSDFVEYIVWRTKTPLITMACNENRTTASELGGRWPLDAEGALWRDGSLTTAVRNTGICYLNAFVKARQNPSVVIHPLTDGRRILPLDRRGEVIRTRPDLRLIVSYDPNYQSIANEMKPSTQQRFGAIDFHIPQADAKALIIMREGGVHPEVSTRLVVVARQSRELRGRAMNENITAGTLIHAGTLNERGIAPADACILAMTDDVNMPLALDGFVEDQFGNA
jgi:nitric oxide reductase NorQ protein